MCGGMFGTNVSSPVCQMSGAKYKAGTKKVEIWRTKKV